MVIIRNDAELEALQPDETEAELAREASRRLSPFARKEVQLRCTADGTTVELPLTSQVVGLLLRILTEMAEGNAVTIVPIHAELTTQQAADLLGVSRPFLIGLLDRDEIPHRLVGTHRRVRFRDLVEYKKRQDKARDAALDDLSAIGQELRLDD